MQCSKTRVLGRTVPTRKPRKRLRFRDLHGRTLALENALRLFLSVAMPAESRREKIFDFVREFAVKYFRIVPVRDSTQQNKD